MSKVVSPRTAANRPAVLGELPDDRLEISETGQILSSMGTEAPIRAQRVAEIRRAIAEGTYETPDKIALTVDRLFETLRAMSVDA
jgi:anti-sigma28 factor (negative regulator of flagellin synthesis)